MAKNPQICFVGNLPKPYGGVASHCYYLAKALIERNIDIYFIDTIPEKDKKVIEGMIYQNISFPRIKNLFKLFLTPLFFLKFIKNVYKFRKPLGKNQVLRMAETIILINKLYRKYRFEVIHSQHCSEFSLAALIAAEYLKKPLILTIHGAELTHQPIWEMYQSLMRHVIEKASKIITVSGHTGSWIKKRGIEKRYTVVPNGIDINKFRTGLDASNLREQFHLTKKQKVLLFTGAISKRKGIDILVKCIPYLKYINFKLIIVGTRSDFSDSLENLISKLKIEDKITVAGEVDELDLPIYYNLADVFVFPTNWQTEGFGIVAIEAMACGVPVVGSNVGPIPEIVKDNLNGLLFEPGDEKDLARKIDKLLDDEKLSRQLGGNGRKIVETAYTWNKIAEKTKKVYTDACAV